MFKKVMVHMKRSMKITVLSVISVFLIVGAVAFLYKPTYNVVINGEQVGYTENKSQLQEKINKYIEKGEGENVAFVQVDNLPEYTLCLLKKDIVANDDEIFDKVKNTGVTYYRYYALAEENEEKIYVSDFAKAESIVNTLKEKESTNIDNIAIVEKYETSKKDFIEEETAIEQLFKEPEKVQVVTANRNVRVASSGFVNTSSNISGTSTSLGISLIRPISGTISSRFGVSSSIRRAAHTGLDISAPAGTAIGAAAAGTVTFSGYKGSYGNMLVINHGNGVQTYYGHCSQLYASTGESVSQGETVATVGSTGNSTGPHLHLEVRVNGVAYNPQNYVY